MSEVTPAVAVCYVGKRISHLFSYSCTQVVHRATKEIMVMKVNKEDSDEDTVLEEIFLLSRLSHENVLR